MRGRSQRIVRIYFAESLSLGEQKFFQKKVKSVYQRAQLDQKRPYYKDFVSLRYIDHVIQQPKETYQWKCRGPQSRSRLPKSRGANTKGFSLSHYHFTRLNPKKKGPLKFCLPASLGIHRNSNQKEFFSFTEGFLI